MWIKYFYFAITYKPRINFTNVFFNKIIDSGAIFISNIWLENQTSVLHERRFSQIIYVYVSKQKNEQFVFTFYLFIYFVGSPNNS